MRKNMGRFDRFVRLIVGAVLIAAPLLNLPPIWTSAVLAYSALIFGAIFVLTASIGTCPVYRLLDVSTAHRT